MTGDESFIWLAGLLEGEGSFLKPAPSKPVSPQIDLEMKDEDVVARVAALFGQRYRVRPSRRPNTSTTYHVRIAGRRAAQLMWRLRPFLSERRQAQIDRAIAATHRVIDGVAYHPANDPPYALRPLCTHWLCTALADECAGHGKLAPLSSARAIAGSTPAPDLTPTGVLHVRELKSRRGRRGADDRRSVRRPVPQRLVRHVVRYRRAA